MIGVVPCAALCRSYRARAGKRTQTRQSDVKVEERRSWTNGIFGYNHIYRVEYQKDIIWGEQEIRRYGVERISGFIVDRWGGYQYGRTPLRGRRLVGERDTEIGCGTYSILEPLG